MLRPYLLDFPLRRDDFDIPAVAKALSHLNRYGGRGDFPISIATHSHALTRVVPEYLEHAALLHDCSEIWFGDVPAGVKRLLPDYRQLENELIHRIFGWFGIPVEHLETLHFYDVEIRNDEMRSAFPLYDRSNADFEGLNGFGITFVPTSPIVAATCWLAKFEELFG
jgi:hypothetical protein